MDLDNKIKNKREKYKLVASITEASSYYLFTPDNREIVFKTKWKKARNFIASTEANHAEKVVANELYKTNQIIN